MNLKNEFGMKLLLAKCPNCDLESLYCGRIPTSVKTLKNKEVLFCKNCKFVVTVNEYKKMLSQA
jgi:transcription elongation factor Elf1